METADKLPVIATMLGTAGHVDHGKTALTKRLTDFDTDRIPEEKLRGMSIDFAVAPFRISHGVAGIIDLPGHSDFVRNMVAGASAVDIVMLVVAADDGVMPQTKEHAVILGALGVKDFILVVSKCDIVSPERAAEVESEARALLESIGVKPLACFKVSSESGEGIAELRQDLELRIKNFKPSKAIRGFRMPIRTAFSIKGHGTVVTGVPTDGEFSGEALELLPQGENISIRGIENYRRKSVSTAAHMSSALNVRDAEPSTFERGSVLAEPGVYRKVNSALCLIKNIGERALSRRGELGLHQGTFHAACRYRLIDSEKLLPGQEAFARLNLTQPAVLAAGDRVLFRILSPLGVAASGLIVGTEVGRMRALTPRLVERLIAAKTAVEDGDVLSSEVLSHAETIFRGELLQRLTLLPKSEQRRGLEKLLANGSWKPLGDDYFLYLPRIGDLRQSVMRMLARYHQLNRHAFGMKPELLASELKVSAAAVRKLEPQLTQENQIVIRNSRFALSEFSPLIGEREMKMRNAVLAAVASAGTQALARGEIQSKVGAGDSEFRSALRLLGDEDEIAIVGKHIFTRALFDNIKSQLFDLFDKNAAVDLALFRQTTGLSRNLAAEFLDFLDAQGITKRVDQSRVLLRRN